MPEGTVAWTPTKALRLPAGAGGALWGGALFAILSFLILYPLATLVLGAFTAGEGGAPHLSRAGLTVATFVAAFSNAALWRATGNSILICIGGTAIATVVGLLLAWIVVRTTTPFRRLASLVGVSPLFVPPIIAAVGWSILGSPRAGLLNRALTALGLPAGINLYSSGGMVFIFGLYYAPYVFLLTSPALRNMDPSLEEAAATAGVGPGKTLFTITLPLISPAVLSAGLLSFVVMLGTYGIPIVLGTPAKIPLITTYLYDLVALAPPHYHEAAAASFVPLAITVIGVGASARLLRGRSFVTVTGKSREPARIELGGWRYAALFFVLVYLLAAVLLPLGALVMAAFRNFLFIPTLASLFDARQYGLMHFARLFADPLAAGSVVNSFEASAAATALGVALAFALAYTVHRSLVPGRAVLGLIGTLPIAIPSLVVGVAYVWAWIGLPGGLYGTLWIIVLAFVARFLPDALAVLSSSLRQVHRDLEEASFICGRGRGQTILRILLPITAPGIVSAATLLFILSVHELGSSLFLYASNTTVMSVLLNNYLEGGELGVTAAFSVVQCALLLLAVAVFGLLARAAVRMVGAR